MHTHSSPISLNLILFDVMKKIRNKNWWRAKRILQYFCKLQSSIKDTKRNMNPLVFHTIYISDACSSSAFCRNTSYDEKLAVYCWLEVQIRSKYCRCHTQILSAALLMRQPEFYPTVNTEVSVVGKVALGQVCLNVYFIFVYFAHYNFTKKASVIRSRYNDH